jgi:hypothetical protein
MNKQEIIELIEKEIEMCIELRAGLTISEAFANGRAMKLLIEKMINNTTHDIDVLKKIKKYINT